MISPDAKRQENAAVRVSVGPFALGRCLGRGGFGSVYEGIHGETGQRVAIKLLHGTKELEPEIQNRFVREIVLLKRLDHENIVRVVDAGLHEESIYCAMELVECGSLKDVLMQRGRLPWREAAEVAVQVCRALFHAHQRGCIHRDLKPANLYLSEDGFVKLGDLGLARDLNSSRLTTSGHTVGTWRYMSPEQITAQDDIDGRLDIYALGCILFEMISGKVPFDGANFAEIFDQHLESAPPRLDVVVSDCPREVADLVDAMLEKQPEDRPQTAEQVAERLEQLLSGNFSVPRYNQSIRAKEERIQATASSLPNLTQRLQSGPIADASQPKYRGVAAFIILLAVLGAILLALR